MATHDGVNERYRNVLETSLLCCHRGCIMEQCSSTMGHLEERTSPTTCPRSKRRWRFLTTWPSSASLLLASDPVTPPTSCTTSTGWGWKIQTQILNSYILTPGASMKGNRAIGQICSEQQLYSCLFIERGILHEGLWLFSTNIMIFFLSFLPYISLYNKSKSCQYYHMFLWQSSNHHKPRL